MTCNMSYDKEGKPNLFVCTRGKKNLTKEEMENTEKKISEYLESIKNKEEETAEGLTLR